MHLISIARHQDTLISGEITFNIRPRYLGYICHDGNLQESYPPMKVEKELRPISPTHIVSKGIEWYVGMDDGNN